MSSFKTPYGEGLFSGYQIIEDSTLIQTEIKKVPRTWRERFFTLPWRPLKATKLIVNQIPSREFYMCHKTRALVMHPALKAEILQSIEGFDKNRANLAPPPPPSGKGVDKYFKNGF